MEKISAVYKITNTVTKDFYIGSSRNVKQRWDAHKNHAIWKIYPNNPLYLDMQKYGIDKFDFQILANVESEQLKEAEQEFIEKLKPTYNARRANGLDFERAKRCRKKYQQSEKGKSASRKYNRKYWSKQCNYKGETLTLQALYLRFRRVGIENPILEAKKYLEYNDDE